MNDIKRKDNDPNDETILRSLLFLMQEHGSESAVATVTRGC